MFLRCLFSLLCSLALLLEGCVPLIFTAGAGAGYVASKPKHRHKVENFFDDLGRSIKQTTRRLSRPGTSRRQVPSTSRTQNGFALKILKSSLTPAKVHPGEKVRAVLQYSILGAPSQGVALQERSSLIHAGKVLAVLKEENSTKENGEWEDTLSFNVPRSAKPGKYTLKFRLGAGKISRTVQRSFSVIDQ